TGPTQPSCLARGAARAVWPAGFVHPSGRGTLVRNSKVTARSCRSEKIPDIARGKSVAVGQPRFGAAVRPARALKLPCHPRNGTSVRLVKRLNNFCCAARKQFCDKMFSCAHGGNFARQSNPEFTIREFALKLLRHPHMWRTRWRGSIQRHSSYLRH